MPKEECKVAPGCKQHKERKPKKPHYIPRPFGKPYNYKCFQCPFTCMEKSHLYNHMKYSLCKNSLSLLIESDWPYKKGNHLPADHLRLQQGAPNSCTSLSKEVPEGHAGADDVPTQPQNLDLHFSEDLDERDAEAGAVQPETADTNGTGESPKQEAELVMADVFSLEEQLLRARSVEVEAKLRHYRLSKTCLSGPAALLSEQFRLLSNQAPGAKPKSDAGSLPCYPPPLTSGHLECPETPGLNLSLLGVGYPLTPVTPGLFSYLNPALSAASAAAAAAATTVSSPAQIGPLPFLASAAQLSHTHTHSDRALLTPPRLYYPFLCEHSFGDQGKALKSSVAMETSAPTFTPKLNMWKVPALRPASSQASGSAWASPSRTPVPARDSREPGGKRPATDSHNTTAEKKIMLSFPPDQTTPTATISGDRLLLTSLRSQAGLDEHFPVAPPSPGSSPHRGCERVRDEGEEREQGMEALLRDLSSALQEYQQAERQASLQPEQRHLWAHLGKIRSELSHIQVSLERAARQSEGPLDLSVKKEPVAMVVREESWCSETEEDEDDRDEGETEEEEGEMKERRKRSLEVLIKLNQPGVSVLKPGVSLVKSGVPLVKPGISVVKPEVLPVVGGALALRTAEAEALWHSRTTKCEADSSVLLCSKTPNRPPSIHHLDTVCPHSPLTPTDS